MSNSQDSSFIRKTNYIVIVQDVVHDVLVKSFIANSSLASLWNELTVYYGSLNLRSKKSGTLDDPVLLCPSDYKVIVLGEVLDTGVIKVFDTDISRSISDILAFFDNSQWSQSNDQRTE